MVELVIGDVGHTSVELWFVMIDERFTIDTIEIDKLTRIAYTTANPKKPIDFEINDKENLNTILIKILCCSYLLRQRHGVLLENFHP